MAGETYTPAPPQRGHIQELELEVIRQAGSLLRASMQSTPGASIVNDDEDIVGSNALDAADALLECYFKRFTSK